MKALGRLDALTFELSASKTDIAFKAPNEEGCELSVKSIQRIVALHVLFRLFSALYTTTVNIMNGRSSSKAEIRRSMSCW